MIFLIFFALFAVAVSDRPHVFQPGKQLIKDLKRNGNLHNSGNLDSQDGLVRIVGGTQIGIDKAPWQVSLQSQLFLSIYSHVCGGSILSATKVLTAAHCIQSNTRYRIRAGSSSKSSGGQYIDVDRIVLHAGYDAQGDGFPNDIAILTLRTPLTFNQNVQPALLPTTDFNPDSSSNCAMTGWGTMNDGGGSPDMLRGAYVDPIDNEQCQSMMGNINGATILDHHVCPYNGQQSSCSGDSGGPYICKQGNTNVLTGVTSWGIQSNSQCSLLHPSVYVRVSSFIDWIQSNM